MVPIFIVAKSNGEVWFATNETDALSIGGTIHKVTSLASKQKIFTATGCSSISSTTKSGLHNDIS